MGEKENKKPNSPLLAFYANCMHGLVVVGSYSLCEMRTGDPHHEQRSNLVEKAGMRIIENGGRKKK